MWPAMASERFMTPTPISSAVYCDGEGNLTYEHCNPASGIMLSTLTSGRGADR